jgi:transcriptional regulator with XRE-family HTH domain
MAEQPRTVLGEVLLRAREGVNRSPEQVGSLVGISGRTVRRLEAGQADRPRRVTLEALAGFYGLNPEVVNELARFKATAGNALLAHLRERVGALLGPGVVEALSDADGEAVELAMRLARLSGARADGLTPERGKTQLVIAYLRAASSPSPREHSDVVDAFVDFLALDRTRQALARQLLKDLRRAQESEGGS